jgi:hypothetical protein
LGGGEPIVKPTEKVGFLFWERRDIAGKRKVLPEDEFNRKEERDV